MDEPFFERLPEHLDGTPVEFRHLVQEQHPEVRERDLSGPGAAAGGSRDMPSVCNRGIDLG